MAANWRQLTVSILVSAPSLSPSGRDPGNSDQAPDTPCLPGHWSLVNIIHNVTPLNKAELVASYHSKTEYFKESLNIYFIMLVFLIFAGIFLLIG